MGGSGKLGGLARGYLGSALFINLYDLFGEKANQLRLGRRRGSLALGRADVKTNPQSLGDLGGPLDRGDMALYDGLNTANRQLGLA